MVSSWATPSPFFWSKDTMSMELTTSGSMAPCPVASRLLAKLTGVFQSLIRWPWQIFWNIFEEFLHLLLTLCYTQIFYNIREHVWMGHRIILQDSNLAVPLPAPEETSSFSLLPGRCERCGVLAKGHWLRPNQGEWEWSIALDERWKKHGESLCQAEIGQQRWCLSIVENKWT